jgi:hypothetical protein
MLSLEEFKAELGPLAERYTDADIARLRDLTSSLAALVFDLWLDTKTREHQRPDLADSDDL